MPSCLADLRGAIRRCRQAAGVALGAQRRDVLRLVVGKGAGMAAAVGIAAAVAVSRLIASQLFGVSATDPLTLTCAAIALPAAAVVASYLPARRATRIDPVAALRE